VLWAVFDFEFDSGHMAVWTLDLLMVETEDMIGLAVLQLVVIAQIQAEL